MSEPSGSETVVDTTDSDGIDDPVAAVVGVGNPIMGDDGVGERVVEELRALPEDRTDGVRLVHAGTTAFFALEAMSGCDRAIVVDAIAAGGRPGTIHRYRRVDGAFTGEAPEMTMHDFSFVQALEAGREAYDIPPELLVYGVEPARIEPTMELSEPVEAAVPTLIDLVLEGLAEHRPTDGASNRTERANGVIET